MPSAPLFYQPLVHARVLATPVGDTTVLDAQLKQSTLVNEAYQNPKFRPRMDAIMRGFEGLQSELPGSTSLDHIQFAFDETGYVANRVATTLRIHPSLFDSASPDQAAEMGANLVKEAQKELAENPGMRAAGDTLEVAPDVSHLLKAHWEGETLGAPDAAYIGVTAGRELQRSVTPLEPDSTHPTLQWVEDASQWMLAMWPGAASKVASAIGLSADAAQIEQLVDGWRGNMDQVEPKVAQPVASLTAMLGAAGIVADAKTPRDAAFQVLQSTPLDGVPAGLAQAIVAHNELPPEASGYFAGRIVETGGTPGNVKGMLAEIELMKRPPPVEPPPGADPPGADPPGTEPPPPGGPTPEPPPGTEPSPPVDPPVDPKPDPRPDPDPDPDPDAKPPADPQPDPKPDPKSDPDASGDGHDHAAHAQGDTIASLMGSDEAGGAPMDPAEFERLLAEVRAEIDAEQGPHPVNAQA